MRCSGTRREIAKIRKILNETCGLNYLSVKDANFMLDKICEALAVDEKSNGWIPVSERLPEIKKNYLECYLVTDGRFYWMAYLASEKEWVFAERTDCKNKIDWTNVVAWMPLPEPYKEDEL